MYILYNTQRYIIIIIIISQVGIVSAIIVLASPSHLWWEFCTVSAFIFSCDSCNWMICGYNCREFVVRAVTRVLIIYASKQRVSRCCSSVVNVRKSKCPCGHSLVLSSLHSLHRTCHTHDLHTHSFCLNIL